MFFSWMSLRFKTNLQYFYFFLIWGGGQNRDFDPPQKWYFWRSHMQTILYFGKGLPKLLAENFL